MAMSRTSAAFAAGVSRALHKQGITVLGSGTPYTREGIRVRKFMDHSASVTVDLDAPSAAKRLADAVEEALTTAGYLVERRHDTAMWAQR
jgi:hypothetical protein